MRIIWIAILTLVLLVMATAAAWSMTDCHCTGSCGCPDCSCMAPRTFEVPAQGTLLPDIELPAYHGLPTRWMMAPPEPMPPAMASFVQRASRLVRWMTPEARMRVGDTIIRIRPQISLGNPGLIIMFPLDGGDLRPPDILMAPLDPVRPGTAPAVAETRRVVQPGTVLVKPSSDTWRPGGY